MKILNLVKGMENILDSEECEYLEYREELMDLLCKLLVRISGIDETMELLDIITTYPDKNSDLFPDFFYETLKEYLKK